MDIESGYYISLNDAIETLAIYLQEVDGVTAQKAIQMLPRVRIVSNDMEIKIDKAQPRKAILTDCNRCIHQVQTWSMKNVVTNRCALADAAHFYQLPPVEDFKCTKFEQKGI